jgi:hypothetical protein
MTVKLDLSPEVEKRLADLAQARGVSVEGYIQELIEASTASFRESSFETRTPEERATAWKEWADSHSHRNGPEILDDSREGIYREREDSQL